jgi:pullulanase/glycogen debranching enzyme
MQRLGMSLVGLGQGIPFFHAGVDLLRSKSLDRNSYNSGDWFNTIDFTYDTNNWGVGLPPAGDNQSTWPIARPLLADPALTPARADILAAAAHFREVLAIRKSSRLFRLRTGAEIAQRVAFFNSGPGQVPGLIVMSLTDADGSVDRRARRIVVLFNANDEEQRFTEPSLSGEPLRLHPLQRISADSVVRTASFDGSDGAFSVPGRTAAVFVGPRPARQRMGLLSADVETLVANGTLGAGVGNALRAKLAAADASIDRGNGRAAANQLGAFANEVRALVQSGRLPAGEGAALIAEALEIAAGLL